MNPAHTRDPEELPRALLHVHRRHRRAAEPSLNGDGRLAMRRGAAAVILGNGVVHHVGAPGTAARGTGEGPRSVRTTVPRPHEGGPDLATVRPPLANLPYGFCTKHLVPLNGDEMSVLLAASRHNIIPFMEGQRQHGAYSATFVVDGGAMDDPDPRRLIDSIMSEVWPLEDALCAEQLGRLPQHEMALERCGGSADVAGLVDRLNAGGGLPVRLDTAFVSPSLVGPAGRGDGPAGYANVLRHRGTTVISSGRVPDDTVYVTSSNDGPVFINGPTVMRMGGDGLDIAHYCAAYVPAGGEGGLGRGFAVAVE